MIYDYTRPTRLLYYYYPVYTDLNARFKGASIISRYSCLMGVLYVRLPILDNIVTEKSENI